MTEAEWLACEDALELLVFLRGTATDRKLRLFACHCLRSIWETLPFESQECVKYVEKNADGLLTATEVHNRVVTRTQRPDFPFLRWLPFCLVRAGAMDAALDSAFWVHASRRPEMNWADWSEYVSNGPPYRWVPTNTAPVVLPLRDIFGNPFRPVTFSPAWRTDTVVALARQMYESRDFGAMPILADALQDAGCEDEQILAHCRDANATHVRGCWVVDLVLWKE